MCALHCAYCGSDWWHLNVTSVLNASSRQGKYCDTRRHLIYMKYDPKALPCKEEEREKIALWEGEECGALSWTDLLKKHGWNVSFGGRGAFMNIMLRFDRKILRRHNALLDVDTLRPNEYYPLHLACGYLEDDWIEFLCIRRPELTRCWLADWYSRLVNANVPTIEDKSKLRQLLKLGCEDQLYRPCYAIASHASHTNQYILEQEHLETTSTWKVGDILLCRDSMINMPNYLILESDGAIVLDKPSYFRKSMEFALWEAVATDIAIGIDGITPCVRIHYSKCYSAWDEWIYVNSSRLIPWPKDKAKPLNLTLPIITLIETKWPAMRPFIEEVLHDIRAEYRSIHECLDAASKLPSVVLLLIMEYTLPIVSTSAFTSAFTSTSAFMSASTVVYSGNKHLQKIPSVE